MNKYKILLIIGISAYTSLVARENPFAKAYETQETQEKITTEGIKSKIIKEENLSNKKDNTVEVKTLHSIEKEMEIIKKGPEALKNNDDNNKYIDGSPITEAVWEKLEKERKLKKDPIEPIIKPVEVEAKTQVIEPIPTIETQPIQNIETTTHFTKKTTFSSSDVIPLAKTYPVLDNQIENSNYEPYTETQTQYSETQTQYIEPVPYVEKVKKRNSKKRVKSKLAKYKTAFKNNFVTVEYGNRSVKIITKNRYIKKRYFKNPKRVSFDFQGDPFFKSGNKVISKNYANRIRVGAHGDFFRVTINLKNKNKAIAHTRPYGLLINFR